ncbi:MAG: hypothetical protein CMG11_05725 [Candidatus Marinimicrobia bacterium]|nr:hypothetical protein [Candidatus Neomarinimicrobiota bacterium]|tara:strand:- start:1334 stop:2107 length:774 start_codon:yes stop_codon:yes gene_type:complete
MTFRILFLALTLNLSFSDFVNTETGWSFVQSTSQAFYMFETLELDEVVAIGDGCAAADCESCYCCQNPGSCDVIGAFFNDVCIGWIYVNQEGWTTVPTNGNDGGEYSENYPSIGDQVNFIIYDSSENRSYYLEAYCQEEDGDCSWANFGMFLYGQDDYTLDNDSEIFPETFNILNTYPNPFNPNLSIDFYIESPGVVDLEVYDIMGNLVEKIITQNFTASGLNTVVWNAEQFSSGEYIVRLKIDEVVYATKMVALVK